MTISRSISLFIALAVAGCSEGQTGQTGNVTMRDMEVIDGTANDSMVDLDNVAQDIAPMATNDATGNSVAPTVRDDERPDEGGNVAAE